MNMLINLKAIINIPIKRTEEGNLFGSINMGTIAHLLKKFVFVVKRS
jgi:ribosomal protein L9